MALPKLNYIHTGKDGTLGDTTEQDIDALFEQLAKQERIVIHFHGGLVDKATGLSGAERLFQHCYEPSGAYPVFFVWESGFLETITRNLPEIAGEGFFKNLLEKVLSFTVGKLEQDGGSKGSIKPLYQRDVQKELARRDKGEEPFAEVQTPVQSSELSETEAKQFADDLALNDEFQNEVRAIVAGLLPEPVATGEKGAVARVRRSSRTLMSPGVIEQLRADVEHGQKAGAKGILSTAALIKSAVLILARVISRFAHGRDHGVYPTVVEEILRELYLDNVGEKIWGAMKRETHDTFQASANGTTRGGRYFVKKLGDMVRAGHRPKITLVGHSAGAVFINHFLAHVAKARQDAVEPFPADFVFKRLILIAPACTMSNFLPTITTHRTLFESFRMFTMSDAKESADVLVPFIYTRSLLYLISGILEKEANGKGAFDMPLLGMERYHTRTGVYTQPEIAAARKFFQDLADSAVWSPSADGAGFGLRSAGISHGGFPDEPQTSESVRHLLSA